MICEYCNKEFTGEKTQKYCSRKCAQKARRTGREVTCDYCGKKIYRKGYRLNKSKHKIYFCSKKCQDLSQSDYSDGSNCYGQELNKPRSICQAHYPTIQCSHCGYDERSALVEVHHIDSNRKNNSPENLIWLCSMCHRAVTLGIAEIVNREFFWK